MDNAAGTVTGREGGAVSGDGRRHIVATSASFNPDRRFGARVGPVQEFAFSLSGATRPRVCLVNTATGDDPAGYARGYAALARWGAQPSHLALFPMPNTGDMTGLLLAHDVVWVGGGSVANLLALWRLHGLDAVMREAWEAGVVLGGVSAGSLCWHVGGTTDSYGPDLRPVTDGLALLPHSNTPHYDSEEQRRPLYQRLVAAGTLPAGWATDDGVGLHFVETGLVEVVSERPDAYAWRVERAGDGSAVESRVQPRRVS